MYIVIEIKICNDLKNRIVRFYWHYWVRLIECDFNFGITAYIAWLVMFARLWRWEVLENSHPQLTRAYILYNYLFLHLNILFQPPFSSTFLPVSVRSRRTLKTFTYVHEKFWMTVNSLFITYDLHHNSECSA